MKKYLVVILGIIVILILYFLFVFKASAHYKEKLTVCHKTHSETNPWVEQTINANELQSHLDNGDFIVNSDHPCPPVEPTPTISPTETPEITPKPCDEDCITPTPEPCVVFVGEFPEPCPTVTPTPPESNPGGPKGDDRGDYHASAPQTPEAPTCNIPFEAARVWYTKVNGKVIFNWATDAQDIQKFSILYGYKADKLEFGVDNLPSTSRSLEIKGLTHSPVFFQVLTWSHDCEEASKIIDP